MDVEIDSAFLAYMLDSEAPAPEAQAAAPTVSTAEERAALIRSAPGVPPEAAMRARMLERANADTPPSATSAARPRLRSLTEEEAIQEAEALAVDDSTLPAADEDPAAPHPLARLKPYAWPAGIALGAVLLIAQMVNHYRDELAASARFNHPLTALYGSLGIHLFPRWDLRAYDVRQLGASGDPAGAGLITVRASIKNGASQPQPLPLLRVTLQDRFGNRIAARDVAPKAYLPSAMPASSFLSAGQRIDAQMGFADPGPDAVGFEIDACLPASAASSPARTTLHCAEIAAMNALRIGPYELPSNVVLAPMAGVTDRPFRVLCRSFGAGLAASEMITTDTRLWNTTKSRNRMDHEGEPEPRVVQLAGADPQALAEAARANVDLGAQIIDINMGCPAKKVCGKLCGSALLTDEPLVAHILESGGRRQSTVPVTLKIRTGWDRERSNGVRIAHSPKPAASQRSRCTGARAKISTTAQRSTTTIREIKSRVRIPLFANGDIDTPEKAREVLDFTGADGVMLGRASAWLTMDLS